MAKVLSDNPEAINELDPSTISKKDFRKLALEEKCIILDNLVLDSIFDKVSSGGTEIAELMKYRQHVNRKVYNAKANKKKKQEKLFISDELIEEPEVTTPPSKINHLDTE